MQVNNLGLMQSYHKFLQNSSDNSKMLRTPILGNNYNKYKIIVFGQNPKIPNGGYSREDEYAIKKIDYDSYLSNWKNNSNTPTQKKILEFIKNYILYNESIKELQEVYDYILFSNMIKKPTLSNTKTNVLGKSFLKDTFQGKNLVDYEIYKFKPNLILFFGSTFFKKYVNCDKYVWEKNMFEGSYFQNHTNKIPVFLFHHPSYGNLEKQLKRIGKKKVLNLIKKRMKNKYLKE